MPKTSKAQFELVAKIEVLRTNGQTWNKTVNLSRVVQNILITKLAEQTGLTEQQVLDNIQEWTIRTATYDSPTEDDGL